MTFSIMAKDWKTLSWSLNHGYLKFFISQSYTPLLWWLSMCWIHSANVILVNVLKPCNELLCKVWFTNLTRLKKKYNKLEGLSLASILECFRARQWAFHLKKSRKSCQSDKHSSLLIFGLKCIKYYFLPIFALTFSQCVFFSPTYIKSKALLVSCLFLAILVSAILWPLLTVSVCLFLSVSLRFSHCLFFSFSFFALLFYFLSLPFLPLLSLSLSLSLSLPLFFFLNYNKN